MRTAESIRNECETAGYRAPDFAPKFIQPDKELDKAEPELQKAGKHLFSACWEKWMVDAVGKYVSQVGLRLSDDEMANVLQDAWSDVCRTWVKSAKNRGRRVMVGGAVRHAMARVKERFLAYTLSERLPLVNADFTETVDGRSTSDVARSYSGMNDRYFRLTPEDIVIRHVEWDDVQSALARLPVVQREAAVGRLMGRPQTKTARLLGVDVRTVQRAERDVAHVLRSHDWEESSLEGLPVLVIPHEQPH